VDLLPALLGGLIILMIAQYFFTDLAEQRRAKEEDSPAPIKSNIYVSRKALLTKTEILFFRVLQEAFGEDYLIFSMVRLADIAQAKRGLSRKASYSAFNRIKSKHLDFVLCNKKDLSIVCAIELNDKSHNRPDRIKRDEFVASVFESIDIPLLFIPVQDTYPVADLKKKLEMSLSKDT